MMKSVSESIRETLNRLEAMSKDPDDYTFTTTVGNLVDHPQDDDEWQDDIPVGVNYTLVGSYRPATEIDPAEYPQVDITGVFDLRTGEDITQALSDEAYAEVLEKATRHSEG